MRAVHLHPAHCGSNNQSAIGASKPTAPAQRPQTDTAVQYARLAALQVTGAGHGIGREVALQYATCGATVVCMDINEKGAAETVKDLKGMGAKAAAYK